MKLGKNFATWMRLIFLVVRAIVHWSKSKHPADAEPGPEIASEVLSDLIKVNEDDAHTSIDPKGEIH